MSDRRPDRKASRAALYVLISLGCAHEARRGWQQALRVLCKARRRWRSKTINVGFRFFDLVFIVQRTYLAAETAIWMTLWGQKVFSIQYLGDFHAIPRCR